MPEVLANTLDSVGVDVIRVGEDGARGVGADYLYAGVLLLEVVSRPGDRTAGPMPATKCVTLPAVCSQISGPVVS